MHRDIRWIAIGALSFVAFVVTGACGSDNGDSDGGDTTQSGSKTVKMLDSVFEPDHLTVKAGTTMKFELPNVGVLPHNMHIASARGVYRESPWVSQPEPINGGKTGSLTWEVPAEAGTYKFRCDYHESTMFGTITVEP
jgi:plastocyanin